MSDAFWDWEEPMQFKVIKKIPQDGELFEKTIETVWFRGVFEPLPQRMLLVKPEGQRQWIWWTLWTTQCLDLDTIIRDKNGVEYRVMLENNWRNGGYRSYEITQGFQKS